MQACIHIKALGRVRPRKTRAARASKHHDKMSVQHTKTEAKQPDPFLALNKTGARVKSWKKAVSS